MKTMLLLSLVIFNVAAVFAQPGQPAAPPGNAPQPQSPPMTAAPSALKVGTANYSITVTWKEGGTETNRLRVLTSEGSFSLETIQGSKKIAQNEVPTSVSLNGTLDLLDGDNQARLKFFLGRTVPYVTSTYGGGTGTTSSSYQQMRVGLQSTFTVTFGKPLVVQADQTGEVTILVKREDN